MFRPTLKWLAKRFILPPLDPRSLLAIGNKFELDVFLIGLLINEDSIPSILIKE
jgi:hypothetical protein